MSDMEEIKSAFGQKLTTHREEHQQRLDTELKELRSRLMGEVRSALPPDMARRLANGLALSSLAPPRRQPWQKVQALFDLGDKAQLKDMDAAFINHFKLERFYPGNRLDYPTVYCETLEEFFTPLVQQLNLSPQARQEEIERMMALARQTAENNSGGGIFGFNLPGQGCYLNGWLFVYGTNISPMAAFQQPRMLERILETAVHEKLGHGFLAVYSALGGVKTRLGLTQVENARRFGLRSADDLTDNLRREQANLLFMVSQLVEEGWATWIETYLAQRVPDSARHQRHSLDSLVKSVNSLPHGIEQRADIIQALLISLAILFGPEDLSLDALHQAVMIIGILGSELDSFFSQRLSQPIRYVVGELLMAQVEANLGAACVPYAALIAANISFDPAQVSLTDLRDLLGRDASIHPDARLAAISRLKAAAPNDIGGMVRMAEAQLSFAIPSELK
jgi:hypothetical protein